MERLQKVMAHCGVASRRKSEQLIIDGRVTVNGKRITELGYKVGNKDQIEVDGVPVYQEEPVYFAFYKPRGVISAVSDDKNRKVVTDFFHGVSERIFPVGRLDYDTSGLIIMTNDGEFANALTHPKHEVNKTYVAKIKGTPTNDELRPLARGVKIDGRKTAPARFKVLSSDRTKNTSIVELIIHEGRNHQVKKMFEAVGFPVIKLKREKIGQLDLIGLSSGKYRELSKKEVSQLLVEAKG
ncbi:rRNA pseudouridine synthase [Vagococcus sp. DIV0080]|uniref:Pseudouridine synthase n=1 Tax=Candidatus Vagococcus giribetii TaxID=2230876 RepID=A0ABS3HSS5_9ENTE|nr:pseudouridine synthase [Vagococcus sp. DIV0080]MBO0476814.1 rRNA pseudouridine synthase [Vagococcus sp. DIV0080]